MEKLRRDSISGISARLWQGYGTSATLINSYCIIPWDETWAPRFSLPSNAQLTSIKQIIKKLQWSVHYTSKFFLLTNMEKNKFLKILRLQCMGKKVLPSILKRFYLRFSVWEWFFNDKIPGIFPLFYVAILK